MKGLKYLSGALAVAMIMIGSSLTTAIAYAEEASSQPAESVSQVQSELTSEETQSEEPAESEKTEPEAHTESASSADVSSETISNSGSEAGEPKKPSSSEGAGSSQTVSSPKVPGSSQESSSSEGPSSSQAPSSSETPSSSERPSSSEGPSSSQEPSSSEGPSSSQEPSSSEGPSSSQEPSSSEGPSSSQEPSSSEAPSSSQAPSSSKPMLPDAFSVKADGKDVTSKFKKNGNIVNGTVVYTVNKLTVSITEYGVRSTMTFDFNDADGVKVSNGVRYTFTLPLVHSGDITDYYTIRVVQTPMPASSQKPSSSEAPSSSQKPSSSQEPSSSEVPSQEPSSEISSQEPSSEPSSEETSSVTNVPSHTQSKPSDGLSGQLSWMIPAAIVMAVLCVLGMLYVIWQLLIAYGIIGKKEAQAGAVIGAAEQESIADLFTESQNDSGSASGENKADMNLDEFFNGKN